MSSILSQITSAYSSPEKLRIRDTARVEKLLEKIVGKGPDALQVITDFDHTLTKFRTPDGLRCETCHGIIDHSPLVPDEYRTKSKELFEKYYPIEVDHEMTIEEKIPLMIEWYEKSHALLASFKIAKSDIKEMVSSSRAILRDNAKETLSSLHECDVPVLIFSAGVGNILEEVLVRDKAFYPNVKVVSNYMDFDDSGRVKSFKKPLIHMFNKNENALEHSTYFDELSHRHNALVLGDSMGDLDMDKGMSVDGDVAVLKIGFLNDKIEERMQEFVKNFDVVLVDDQSFDFVNLILKHVLKNSKA